MFGLKKIKNSILGNHPASCVILMYHHIRSEKMDPWETCVNEDNFKAHLDILAKYYEVSPISDLEKTLSENKYSGKKVFITFDDGYLDNLETAVPLLSKFGFPATFFIPSRILYDQTFFWWEIIDHLFWDNEQLPEKLELEGDKRAFIKNLTKEERDRDFKKEEGWSANDTPPQTSHSRLYLELCAWVKESAVEEQQSIARQLVMLCKNPAIESCRKMSADQIKGLPKQGFEVGAHTVNHPALGCQTREVQQSELIAGKRALEELVNIPVSTIAYPHGHFNKDTKDIVRNAGYQWAFTTESGRINYDTDRFALPRMWVKNIDGKLFHQQLKALFNQN